MGFMDQIKKTASTVGSEAGKAGRVAQAQMKLKSLQGDVGDAEKELGQSTYGLVERGEIQAPLLEAPMAKVREAKAAVAAKEAEIALIKAEGEDTGAAATAAPAAAAAPAGEATPPAGDAGASTQMPGT